MTKAFNISTVTSEDNDIRLDKWFKRNNIEMPFSLLAKLVRKKAVRVNGKKAAPDQRVVEGDKIQYPNIQTEESPERIVKVSPGLLEVFEKSIIFEDENVIAISKPAGIPTQGGTKIKDNIDDISRCYYQDADFTPKLVHRIDMDTTGLLVLAKSANIAAKITEAFRNNEVNKTYLAIVTGVPKPKTGEIMSTETIEKNGKLRKIRAHSYYKTLDYAADQYALLDLNPHTGRKHQLRKHCLKLGTPIMGDEKYRLPGSEHLKTDYLYLHAYKISFKIWDKNYDLTAKPQPHFYDALRELGLDLAT